MKHSKVLLVIALTTQPAYETVIRHGAIPIIAPRKNARVRKGAVFEHRNAAIAACMRWGRKYLEVLDWLPPAKSGGNEDELHQKAGQASDVSHL